MTGKNQVAQKKALGPWGEDQAARFLESQGMAIRARNYRRPCGEIYLLASDEKDYYFIEFKTRRGSQHGYPEAAVNSPKQARVTAAALEYLREHALDVLWRIDNIAVIGDPSQAEAQIVWYENASG